MTAAVAPPSPSPTRRRHRGVVLIAAALAIALLAACSPEQQRAMTLVNDHRASLGIRALTPEAYTTMKAQAWAEQMARDGYIHHSDLVAGLPPGWKMAGENVGCGLDVDAVHKAFLSSAPHKANIENRGYTHAGMGVARGKCTTSRGVTFDAVFVAQVYVQL